MREWNEECEREWKKRNIRFKERKWVWEGSLKFEIKIIEIWKLEVRESAVSEVEREGKRSGGTGLVCFKPWLGMKMTSCLTNLKNGLVTW
jgi:hypothetical protein